MNLDDLLNEMSEKMRNRDLSDEYLREHNNSTREEIGIGEYAYGITMIPCEWVHEYLSDYKRVLKENERLQKENEELREDRDKFKKALGKRITYCNELEKDLFENCSNYVIPIQTIKDKIEKYKKMLLSCNRFSDVDRIKAINERILELEELLEGRK